MYPSYTHEKKKNVNGVENVYIFLIFISQLIEGYSHPHNAQ